MTYMYIHLYTLVQVDRNRLTVEALELLRLIPQGYMPLPHQVGGHRHVDGKLGKYVVQGIIVRERGMLLCPVECQYPLRRTCT